MPPLASCISVQYSARWKSGWKWKFCCDLLLYTTSSLWNVKRCPSVDAVAIKFTYLSSKFTAMRQFANVRPNFQWRQRHQWDDNCRHWAMVKFDNWRSASGPGCRMNTKACLGKIEKQSYTELTLRTGDRFSTSDSVRLPVRIAICQVGQCLDISASGLTSN